MGDEPLCPTDSPDGTWYHRTYVTLRGPIFQHLLKKTERVLKRCQEFNIQLNMGKSRFGVDSILFFGYRLEKGKYGIESSRINDVRDIPFPKTLKQVQRFLGCTTFMSPFIPNYADTFKHIFRMSQKSFSFDRKSWEGTDYVDEWNKTKEHLRRTCTLYHPDRNLEWILKTDASITGYGAVLVQMMPKDKPTADEQKAAEIQGLITPEGTVAVPIALISKAFTEAARMWTTTEQELYSGSISIQTT